MYFFAQPCASIPQAYFLAKWFFRKQFGQVSVNLAKTWPGFWPGFFRKQFGQVSVNLAKTWPTLGQNLARFLAKFFFSKAIWPSFGKLGQNLAKTWPVGQVSGQVVFFSKAKQFGQVSVNLAKTWPNLRQLDRFLAKLCFSKQFGQVSVNLAKTWPVGQVSGQVLFIKAIWPNFLKLGQVSGQVFFSKQFGQVFRNLAKFSFFGQLKISLAKFWPSLFFKKCFAP